MVKKFNKFIKRFKQEKGQSMIILAFAFLGLVAMLGLALDLGLVYIERVALKRAIDAAVLSGVIELPVEEDAGQRALEYLALNGYDPAETKVYFAGCLRINGNSTNKTVADNWVYQTPPTEAQVVNTFWIDTVSFRGDPAPSPTTICNTTQFGVANKIRVRGAVKVDMNFMQFFGFDTVTVGDVGTAQNIDNLDVAVVFDRSGSMEFDPVCYDCWQRDATVTEASTQADTPRWFGYYNYPNNGKIYPVAWNDNGGNPNDPVLSHPNMARVCNQNPTPAARVYIEPSTTGPYYMIMEAELYGRNNSVVDGSFRESGKGYWALERGEGNYEDNDSNLSGSQFDYADNYVSTGYSIDTQGAHMAHHPSLTSYPTPGPKYGHHYTLSDAQNNNAPALEYDFRFRNGGAINWGTNTTAYIWVRVHAGRGLDVDNPANFDDEVNHTDAYWTVVSEADDGSLAMDGLTFNPNTIRAVQQITGTQTYNTIPDSKAWKWVRLEYQVPINTNNVYRLYIYAGSAGISIDRILVTNRTTTLPALFDAAPNYINPGSQPQATAASASRAACDPCNPIFGQNISASGSTATPYNIDDCTFFDYNEPINQALDLLFGEFENPMRTAKEAVKVFVTKLDPKRDQIGLATFNDSSTSTKTFLECLQRYGPNTCPTPVYSYTQVLRDIERVHAGGGTNIGAGMKGGLEVLGYNVYNEAGVLGTGCGGGTCSRGSSAQRIMVLMTDGIPNANPGGVCRTAGPVWDDGSDQSANCPLYFAQQAAQQGIRVYVIGLGYGVEADYLKKIAELGGGQYYFSATGGDLDLIFAQILNNIYVRLVE